MDNIWQSGITMIKERLYPFTIKHLIYVLLFTITTSYIIDYIFKFRLLKWIYIGTMVVIVANLFNQGDDKKAVDEIFKLAMNRWK